MSVAPKQPKVRGLVMVGTSSSNESVTSDKFPPLKKNDSIISEKPIRGKMTTPPPSTNFMPALPVEYGNLSGFSKKVLLKPPPFEPLKGLVPAQHFGLAQPIRKDMCKDSLLKYVSKKSCHGHGMANTHSIQEVVPSHAVHYTLETFTEKRQACYAFEAFYGSEMDVPRNRPIPLPWEVRCPPDELFKDHVKTVEVPNTAVIKECHRCHGNGFSHCHDCHGIGYTTCTVCHGSGEAPKQEDTASTDSPPQECYECEPGGHVTCLPCEGHGRIKCKLCRGIMKIKCHVELTVTFTTHQELANLENPDIHRHLKGIKKQLVFEQTRPLVYPITTFPVEGLSDKFSAVQKKHISSWPDERIIKQQQQIFCAPNYKVVCRWLDKYFEYYVYGLDHEIYFPNYPQSVCWSCTLT